MSLPVFYAPEMRIEALREGAEYLLTGAEAHHAAVVRRIRLDEKIELVNGSGLRAKLSVTNVSRKELRGKILEFAQEYEPQVRLILVQALAKGGRDEQAIETATEYGVNEIIPWEAQRCVVTWERGAKEEKALTKWRSTVLAAAKQSRRSFLPKVHGKFNTQQVAGLIQQSVENCGSRAFICHEESLTMLPVELERIVKFVAEGRIEVPATLIFVVGPEGGITPNELLQFAYAGAQVVTLSPHVLRSATAGPKAIAAAQTTLWDIMRKPAR
ncbi:16S rRNA (uracil(1498)-N(3))-methyltransferase [Arcanobacterium hippocoleae]|uniref:Ribosomal RNA small subunit methyltransferase E n=1 Tax=Arcanobacterium hippocoleae TaxID=149017 RepID=A0ABU1T0L9_9ACTO|nr:16S rRNA (uracil(1498)-N(3))-methyltransferase [Arcanobacterium hippocoleae]MDR6938919.1 16S rRNA (uracil1498-N3)-methyltransferase [Arcanobacterium hippocoleae]